jgi:putative hydrolase of the HAD superfamily
LGAAHFYVKLLVDALLLDLDDTLMDDRGAIRCAFAAFVDAHRTLLAGEDEEDALARWRAVSAVHWRRFERGEVSFIEQRRARVRDFLRAEFTDLDADAAFEPYRVTYEDAWSLVPACAPFLERTAHLPKVVVTNGEREQQLRKLQKCGILGRFVATVTPMDCGHWKPSHGIFQAALAHLKVAPSRCLMIGDDLERDILPAKELGMKTFHAERSNPLRTLLHALDAT